MKRENIIVANHAKMRATEINVDPERIKSLFLKAKYQRPNIFRETYKFLKYGKKQHGVNFYYLKGSSTYPPILFTTAYRNKKIKIITLTQKKL